MKQNFGEECFFFENWKQLRKQTEWKSGKKQLIELTFKEKAKTKSILMSWSVWNCVKGTIHDCEKKIKFRYYFQFQFCGIEKHLFWTKESNWKINFIFDRKKTQEKIYLICVCALIKCVVITFFSVFDETYYFSQQSLSLIRSVVNWFNWIGRKKRSVFKNIADHSGDLNFNLNWKA